MSKANIKHEEKKKKRCTSMFTDSTQQNTLKFAYDLRRKLDI